MTVTVLEPGRLVRIERDRVTPADVLEFAEALIEEQGWKKGESGNATEGWSIHGAVGEAARRIAGSSDKGSSQARPLRDEAAAVVTAAYPDFGTRAEYEVNDNAQDQAEVVGILRRLRGAA